MRKVKLQDISIQISSGLTPSRSNPNYWMGGDIFWLKTEQLGERNIYSTSERITCDAINETSIKIFPNNTLSIAMYGEGKTRGNVSILRTAMTTNQACCNIVLNKDIADYEYVYYFLKTQYENLRNLSAGVRKNLNSNDIKQFEIILPDLTSQKKIASVLSALDDKIELNNNINAELEQMAKTLYDYCFVQFDFPNDAGKPYKSSGGRMVYSDVLKREIPEGWEVKSLYSIAKFINGLACQKYRPEKNEDDFLPVVKIREMGEGISANTERARVNIPEKNKIDDGDVLFSWSATLDLKIWSGGRGALNQHIFKVVSAVYPKSFYYFEILNYLKHFKMMAELRKTTMGHITVDHLKASFISAPPCDLIKRIDQKISPLLQKVLLNQKQNQELARLRDWLLPMLMNGQVKVSDNYGRGKDEHSIAIPKQMDIAAEPTIGYQKLKPFVTNESLEIDPRFESWLSHQSLAARGDVDTETLREIFDAMDDEDK